MQKSIRNILMAAVLVLAAASVGHAEGNQNQGNGNNGNRTRSAPEIDPTSAVAALAMLSGGIFVIRARRH